MLPNICLLYLELVVFILIVVFQILKNIIYPDTKTYGSTKPLRILLLVITSTRWILQFHVYIENSIHHNSRISSLSNITSTLYSSLFITASTISSNIKPTINQQGSLWLFCDKSSQKMIYSNKNHLTVSTADLIISEVISFNIYQKPRFKKVLYLARNVSKGCDPPNRSSISKDLLYVIHYQNMLLELPIPGEPGNRIILLS